MDSCILVIMIFEIIIPQSRRDAVEVRELHEGQAPTGEAGLLTS